MEKQIMHRMRRGDTLEFLSAYYRVPVCMIMRVNSFSDPKEFFRCRAIKIPGRDYCNRCEGESLPEDVYTVGQGDTLFSIAKMHRVTMNVIMKKNGIDDAEKIKPGDMLSIPEPAEYMYCVRAGETIEYIASKYGKAADDIRERNCLGAGDPVYPGMQLMI